MPPPIPFNRPCLTGRELDYMAEAVASGHTSAKGPFTERAVDLLRDWHQCEDVLLTTSCTDALEMAALLTGVGPGDVVIVPSFTFTSTALAFAREGASLRFCDIEPDTLCLDPDDVEAAMDDRVRAIVTVHYAGVPSDVGRLGKIADAAGIPLIEDNAHGLFARSDGQPLGTFGRMSTLSFHETKNFICGEGGALILNDPADVERAHILLDKGTNRRAFLRGAVDKYTWQGTGSSFGMGDILAAFLVAQLESRDEVMAARRRVSSTYRALLAPHARELGIQLPYEPSDATPADHMFYVLLSSTELRDHVLQQLRREQVQATFHYVPLHSSPAGRQFADPGRECPVTDDVSGRLLRLPFANSLESSDIERVVDGFSQAVQSFGG